MPRLFEKFREFAKIYLFILVYACVLVDMKILSVQDNEMKTSFGMRNVWDVLASLSRRELPEILPGKVNSS